MSDELKPYFVDVHLTVRVPVVAKSVDDACQVARDHVEDEVESGYGIDEAIDDAMAVLVTEANTAAKVLGTIPWGVCDQDPRRDWDFKKWLEAAGTDS